MGASSKSKLGFNVLTQRPQRLAVSKIIAVKQRSSPLVVSIPHSGTWIPPEAKGHIETGRILLIDTDLLTDQVYAAVAQLGSSVQTCVSPYVVNVNRGYTKPGLPIIPQQLLSGQATLLKPFPSIQRRKLLAYYYQPYHAALQHLITEALKRFGFALVFDGHSLDRKGMVHTKDPGERRADIVIGDNHATAAHPSVTRAIETYLSKAGYEVALNRPYAGGHITRAYGSPGKRVHVIQIELVKSLYCHSIAKESDLARHLAVKVNSGLPKLSKGLCQALGAGLRAAAVA
ncbi:MAG: N-formylglutamate amidohydrolase [Parcubacteria group bacterium]